MEDSKRSRSLADLLLAVACFFSFPALLWFIELLYIRPVDVKSLIRTLCPFTVLGALQTDSIYKGDEVYT